MNRLCYRIVFNRTRSMLMAVAETASGHAGGKSVGERGSAGGRLSGSTWLGVSAIRLAVWACMGLPMMAGAQIVADPNSGANRPTVISTPNGLPQVNITRPSAAGVSTNHYTQFDVNKAGAILNNSPVITNTQQAGYINGNPNLLPGGSARIIVNQVNSMSPSQLRGYLEVAGQRAEVIVANPNGILVDGAGFINTSRATLTTGLPVYGGSGSLDAFRVSGGQISIEGAGLNAAGVDQVDLIARAVKANAAVYANRLNVVAGANQVDYNSLDATAIAGTGAAPATGIDVSQLGGMYANKILLASTEHGVGVSLRGVMAAQAGDMTLTSQGKLVLAGQTNASANLAVSARDGIDNSGTTYAVGAVGVHTDATLNNSGTLAAQQSLSVNAQSVASTGTLAAGLSPDGIPVGGADLTVTSTGAISATGRNLASGNAVIQGESISMAGSQTATNGNLSLSASAGGLDLTGATTTAGAALLVNARGALSNDRGQMSSGAGANLTVGSLSNRGGQIEGGELAIRTTGDLNNQGGTLKQVGRGDTTIIAGGKLDNTGGTIAANGQSLTVEGASLVNDGGQVSHAGTGTLSLASQGRTGNAGGVIQTNGGLIAKLGSLDGAGGTVSAQKALALNVQGALDNANGTLHSGDALVLQADGTLTNAGGRIETAGAHGALSVSAAGVDNTGGRIANAGDGLTHVSAQQEIRNAKDATGTAGLIGGNGALTLDAGTTLTNQGTITARGDATVNAQTIVNDGGNLTASGALQIASTGAASNRGGTISAAATTLNAASLDNAGGRLDGDRVNVATTGDLSNRGGTIKQYGQDDTSVLAGGKLDNTGGTIAANGASLTVDAGTIANDSGQVSHAGMGSLSVTSQGALTNTGGAIQTNGDLQAQATTLDNSRGTVSAQGKATVIAGGNLSNRQGSVYGNAGLILASGGTVDNSAGSAQTGGDLSVSATGAVLNQDGTLAANGAHGTATVAATSIDNTRGSLVNAGDGATTVTATNALTNTAGKVGGNGDVAVAAQTLANNTNGTAGGQVVAGGALDLKVRSQIDNRGGMLYGQSLTLNQAGATLNNAAGQVLGGTDVKLSVASLSNLAGAVKANQDVAVAGIVSGSGTMIAGRNLALNVVGDYTNDASNLLRANGNMQVTATGTLTNTGTLATAGALTVSGANVVNGAAADINSSDTTVTAGNVLSNAGRIEGDTVRVAGPTVINTGTVIGYNVQVQGTDIVNNGPSALMAAVRNLNLYAGNSVQNLEGGTLYSAGNLQIARDGTRDASTGLLANQVNTLINRSSTIEADGDIDIAANQVSNTRTSIVTTAGTPVQTAVKTLTLWQAGLSGADLNVHVSLTFPGWVWSTSNAPISTPQTNALRAPITVTVDKSTVANLNTSNQTLSFTQSPIEEYGGLLPGPNCDIDTGICTRPIATRPTQYYQSIQDNGSTYSITFWPDWDPNIHIRPDEVRQANFGHDFNEISRTTVTMTATDQLVSATDAARIQAAGNIRINSNNGNILNQSSTMAAGGSLVRVAANGTIQDVGTVLQQTVTTQDTSTFYWHQRTGGSQEWQVVAFPDAPQAPTTTAALPAIATANQAVQTTAQNVTVASVNTVGAAVTGSSVAGGGASGTQLAGASGAAGAAAAVNANGSGAVAAAVQTLGTAQGGIPNLKLPTNGLYRIRTAPGDTYLVATDPRFTQYTNFISSDYMLNALGLDPQKTQKRLGDGFYEEKLVRDQITQLTGKTFLTGYTDQLEEYKALMNNGVTYAKTFDLTPGVGLTDEQMRQLTTDMVWMVSQDVTLPDGTTQSVLVPKVYLAQGNGVDLNATGALVAGKSVAISATGNVENSGAIVGDIATQVVGGNIVNRGSIGGTGTTVVSATQDVRNLGGRIGGQDVVVSAGRDVINESQTITNTTTLANGNSASATGVGAVASISGTNNVAVLAGRDISMVGAGVNAGGNALLAAGRDINLGTIVTGTTQDATAHGGQDYLRDRTVINQGSTVQAGGSVTAVAGRDVTLTGSAIDAGGDAALVAGRNTTVTAAMDSRTQEAGAFSNKASQFTQSGYDEGARGSSVRAGDNVVLGAGQTAAASILQANGIAPVPTENDGKGNLSILASSVTTGGENGGGGAAKLAASGDVTIGTVTEQHTSDSWSKSSESGFLSKKQTTTQSSQQQTVAVGSLVSADSVTASAGRDLTVMGSNVAGSGDVALHADRNLVIGAAENTASSTTSQETRTSGMFSGGGASVTFGKQQVNQTQTQQSTTHTGSVVGSVGGNVSLSAGEGYSQTGSTVTALQGDIDIRAKSVDIAAAMDSWQSNQETHFKQSGLTIAVSNPILAAVQTATQMAQAQSQTSDPRMKALAGAATGLAGKNAYDAVSKDPQAAGGITLSITVGGSKSDSTQTQSSTTAVGSQVNAGGNVSIRATGDGQNSNINVVGSDLKAGNDLLLKADNAVNLQAAANTADQHSSSKSVSGGIGLAISYGSQGAAIGVTANASAARGNADGNDVTWTNSHATAGNTLTIESGGDTNIRGAVASGNQVVANVGGNLNLESLQDTSTYHSKDQSASGSVTAGIGFSGSASISQQKMDSDFASVGEQSAIRAGTGGYQVDVKGNTDLKGAVIAGGSADKNSLSTDTLTVSNIENHAHYSASSIGIGGGFSFGGNSGKSGVGVNQTGQASTAGSGAVPGTDLPTTGGGGQGFSAAPPMVAAASGSASSTTQSGISAGSITIRNDAKQQELTGKSATDTVASVNRDTTNTANSLSPIFDANEIKADFQIVGALQREAGVFLNNRAAEAESAKKAADAAAKDPTVSPEKLAELQQQADDLATWGQGGTYRRVATALTAAASGNVTGSSAQFVQSAAVGYLQGLAASQVKDLADSLGKGTPEAETARAALHAIVGCAGAAAANQACGTGAMGAAAASVLGSLLSPTEGMTAGQKQARENAIQSLVAGVAGAVGGNAATAMNAATFEIENNALYVNNNRVAKFKAAASAVLQQQCGGDSACLQKGFRDLDKQAATLDAIIELSKRPQLTLEQSEKLTQSVLELMPVMGNAESVMQLITGKSSVSGEEASRFWASVGLVPLAGGILERAGASALDVVKAFLAADKVADSTKAAGLINDANRLFKQYADDIETQTGYRLNEAQRAALAQEMRTTNHAVTLSPEQNKVLRNEFNSQKNDLILEWEQKTGQKWPTYEVQRNGRVEIWQADAHHVIPVTNAGPAEWWNITPALPAEHRAIHGAGGPLKQLQDGTN